MATLTPKPEHVERGGRVRLTLELTVRELKDAAAAGAPVPQAVANPLPGSAGAPAGAAGPTIKWEIEGLGVIDTTDAPLTADRTWSFHANVPEEQQPGGYLARATYSDGAWQTVATNTVSVVSRPFGRGDPLQVHMRRTGTDPSDDQALWTLIRSSTNRLAFKPYAKWIDTFMCGGQLPDQPSVPRRAPLNAAMAFPGVDPYLLLRAATEVFLLVRCGVHVESDNVPELFAGLKLDEELNRYATDEPGGSAFERAIETRWRAYIGAEPGHVAPATDPAVLPYFGVIQEKLGGQGIGVHDGFGRECYGILREKLTYPCFLELIWSYWHEEGMLTHSMDAIARRFQNVRGPGARDPLAHVEIDPLRALNPILWGYVQDEQHRLTALRRAYEYDHNYGINQLPPNAPHLRPADSRPRFLEAFHTLLNLASAFFREDDDTTVIADGFPVLNALRDVHLLLTEGQHNQYGDLPWTARLEMLMQQWILARPEMREFLPGRTMVAYPEPWMDRVDTMKRLQGWTPDTVIHFRDLGRFGEQLLLSVRFGNWSDVIDRNVAANWVRYWRTEIQGYVHAYRSVTGADLTGTPVDAVLPALRLRHRLAQHRSGRPELAAASTATPALSRRRTAPTVPHVGPAPQLPPAQRPFGAQPASLPPGRQGAPRLPRPEGR